MRAAVLLALALAAALPGCKKKQKKPPEAPIPSGFISTPGAVSEGLTTPTCDNFHVADSAKARALVARLADPATAKELGCFLAGLVQGRDPATLADPAKARTLAEKGDFLFFNLEAAKANPPHWATQLVDAAECQVLQKDGAAVYFCKIKELYRIVQVENLGPG